MHLRESIYEKIDNNRARLALAMALDVTEATIRNYIRDHNENLTKAAALKVIRQYTGLTTDDILMETLLPA
jgi:hypothetical protein